MSLWPRLYSDWVRLLSAIAAMAVLVVVPAAQHGPAVLPERLKAYIASSVKLTAAQRSQLLAGQPVTQLLEADPSREVAIFGAVWIDAPASRYVAALRDIEQFEKGENFLATKRISTPPRLEDFDTLRLPPDDIADLKTCRVGNCELKLSETALTHIQQRIDWSKPTASADAERAVRKMAFDYVNGYLEGGNSRLAAYRDRKRPTFVEPEFAEMVGRMPELMDYLPDLKKYLLEYPRVTLPKAESILYWQSVKFGLKPTVRINHLTIVEEPTHVAAVSKMLYASHYFWTAIELRVLVPDPARGDGVWFVTVNRSRSDGLSGFVGSIIRRKVRSEAETGHGSRAHDHEDEDGTAMNGVVRPSSSPSSCSRATSPISCSARFWWR